MNPSAQDFDHAETARMVRLHRQVAAALRGEWPPDEPEGQVPVEAPGGETDTTEQA